jgi:putative FmdB family regulatory protein
MPTYRYRCESCGDEFEVWQSITDDALSAHDGSTTDGGCGGHLVKVLSPAGIVLKGSGFYKTDNRGSRSSSKNGDGATDTGSKETGSSESGSKEGGSKKSDTGSASKSDSSGSSGSKDGGSSGSGSSGSDSSGSGAKPSSTTSSS